MTLVGRHKDRDWISRRANRGRDQDGNPISFRPVDGAWRTQAGPPCLTGGSDEGLGVDTRAVF